MIKKSHCYALVVDIDRQDGTSGMKIHFLLPCGLRKGEEEQNKMRKNQFKVKILTWP